MKNFILILLALTLIACSRTNTINGPAFGIDVSSYNGEINWPDVKKQTKTKEKISFVIIRATMGDDRIDSRFPRNFSEAKDSGFIVGAYHYYDPNENSTKQAQNFINHVALCNGDIRPILDIEKYPKKRGQSKSSLKKGIRNWINIVEDQYGVKPIIYTGLTMWKEFLSEEFSDCDLWVASYSNKRRNDNVVKEAAIHQFTQNINNLPGIESSFTRKGHVDGNDCRDIKKILIK